MNVPQVEAAIDEGFVNSTAETLTEPEAAFYGGFIAGYRVFFQIAELMGIVVVFTIGLVAANTAAMSIRERRTEIAVLRSIGFPERTILSMLLAESLIIALVGGLLGCGTAYLLLRIVTGSGYVVTQHKYIVIGTKILGQIVEEPIEEGQHVRSGDLLARIDDRDY